MNEYLHHGLRNIELGAGVDVDLEALGALNFTEASFLIHNYFPPPEESFVLNLASDHDPTRARSIAFACEAVNLCASLGVPCYSLHAGFITDPVMHPGGRFEFPAPEHPNSEPRAFEHFVDSMQRVLDHADNLSITLLVENNVCTEALRGKLLLQTPDEFEALFDTIDAERLGILLDTGHLNVSARTFHFECAEFVDRLASVIGAFHVHDNDGLHDAHRPIAEDSWVLDAVRQPRFASLPVVVEAAFGDVQSLRDHVNWLEARLN